MSVSFVGNFSHKFMMAKETEKATENPKSTREARARRLESLRGLTRLSRVEFAKRCGVKSGSFQNWEGPRFGGLTEKAAQKIIRGARALGINCTLEWLMHGIGQGPQIDDRLYLSESLIIRQEPKSYDISENEENDLIAQELLLFRQHNKDVLDFVVTDDAMEPAIKKEDYVAGIARYNKDIEDVLGKECIVKTAEGETLVRIVKKGLTPGYYNLFCSNLNTSVAKPILYDIDLVCAAPVIWIRRHDSIKPIAA